jgi:hypothetical protein
LPPIPWPPLYRPDLAHIATLESHLDRAETAVLRDVNRQQRDDSVVAADRAHMAALQTQLALVRADIAADTSATPSEMRDDLAEANRLAGQISQLHFDIAFLQHDLNQVNAGLAVDRIQLTHAEAALDGLQAGLLHWPVIRREVIQLRSALVHRDVVQADLDRAHRDITTDLNEMRKDQVDLAADHARVLQLQVRVDHAHAVVVADQQNGSANLTEDLATEARLTAWLHAEQADVGADQTGMAHARTQLYADVATANQIMQRLDQAQNAVSADWSALIRSFIRMPPGL